LILYIFLVIRNVKTNSGIDLVTRFIKKATEKIGLHPGALIHIGEKKVDRPTIQIIAYSEDRVEEMGVNTIEEIFPYRDTDNVTWINIDGLHDVDAMEKLGKHFNLHPLMMEDILNTDKRPEIDDYGDYIFMVIKMLHYDDIEKLVKAEQLSIVVCKNIVLTFQERVGDVFNPLRERIRKGRGRVRESGTDYLAYALLDTIVDNYFLILEKFSDALEAIEDELMNNVNKNTIREIHRMKREMVFLRKSVWPVRELVNGLARSESALIDESLSIYVRDLYDHTVQVIDTIETMREMVAGMLDIYLSTVSNRMNEVMKVLTIMASIFIPLTFIAGIYGMNFERMPELRERWGYPGILVLMLVVASSMILYFKKRKWL
jgi:magnesium transporter